MLPEPNKNLKSAFIGLSAGLLFEQPKDPEWKPKTSQLCSRGRLVGGVLHKTRIKEMAALWVVLSPKDNGAAVLKDDYVYSVDSLNDIPHCIAYKNMVAPAIQRAVDAGLDIYVLDPNQSYTDPRCFINVIHRGNYLSGLFQISAFHLNASNIHSLYQTLQVPRNGMMLTLT